MEEQIQAALEVLRKGGVILYPTDTVWGIGCDATNEKAVERVYEIKESIEKKSMIVLVDKLDNVSRYFRRVPDVAWQLLELSETPLTLILEGGMGVAQNLIPDEGTLAVRVPKHTFCEQLLRKLGRPLVSTSANISGEPTPLRARDISSVITDRVDFIVAPMCEGHPTGKASSIIFVGEGGEVKIIRE